MGIITEFFSTLGNLLFFSGVVAIIYAGIKFAAGWLQGGLEGGDQSKALGALGAGVLLMAISLLTGSVDLSWIPVG